jgi:hypothetical protein
MAKRRLRARAPAVSIATFVASFPDEASCLAYVFYHRHALRPRCPRCGGASRFKPNTKPRGFTSQCCHVRLHPFAGLIINSRYIPVRMWFYAMLLFSDLRVGISCNEIGRLLGIPLMTAYSVSDRIRVHMAMLATDHPLGGTGIKVYVDETWLCIGKQQRTILLGITDGERCIMRIIPNRSRRTLFSILRELVLPGSILITDSWAGYRDANSLRVSHSKVNHLRKQWVNAAGDSNAPVEALWRITKRVLRGRSGRIADDNLWKYVGEIMYRYNAGFDPAGGWWRMISSLRTVGPQDIERARQRIDLRSGKR